MSFSAKQTAKGATQDGLNSFLRDMSRHKLLTRNEELFYGKQVWELSQINSAQERFYEQFGHQPSLQELAELINQTPESIQFKLQTGQKAINKLVECNLRLVVAIAKKFSKKIEILDAIQEGSIGLQKAASKFDYTKGYKFSTYAYWWIRQSITRAIAKTGRSIRLPVNVQEQIQLVRREQESLGKKLGRKPSLNELSQVLGMEKSKLEELLYNEREVLSLDYITTQDDETDSLEHFVPDPDSDVFETIAALELRELLTDLTRGLKPRDAEILKSAYGITDDGTTKTLRELGEQFNVSPERIRQIKLKALNWLSNQDDAQSLRIHLQAI